MKKLINLIIVILITGCATKEFEPKHYISKKLSYKNYKELYDYTKPSETFINNGIFYDEKGHKLGKFKKINKDIAVNQNKLLLINEKKVINLPYFIYIANKNKNLIAIIFENNSYGIYDLNSNKLVFYKKDDDVISVKYLGERPIFYNNLILFPLLNGKIAVVDAKTMEFIRNIDISDDFVIDNVIYINIVKDNLFMATPKKLVLFNPNFLIDYKDSIKHIIDYNGYIYLFNNNGRVIKFNSKLKKLNEKEFPFASFFAPSVCKGNIYTITHSGYLIKLTPDLNYEVYKTNQFDTDKPLKIKGCRIYNQDKVFFIE